MPQSLINKLLLLLILTAGFSATYILQRQALNTAKQSQQDNFDYQARDIILRIEQRLSAYEQVLLGTKALFSASRLVNRQAFHDYIANLNLENHFPGIQGVGFSLIIQPSDKVRHIEAIRKEGFPEYTLHPEGERDLYAAVIYLEPFAGRNLRAFGYDIFSEAVRHKALVQARDSDKATITGKIKLLQEAEQQIQAGFLMLLPVYQNDRPHDTLDERRANIIGWVYAPFRIDDLMLGILGQQGKNIGLRIYDGEDATPEALMNHKDSENSLRQSETVQYRFSKKINLMGHVWAINLESLPIFEANINTQQVMMIRLSGIFATILLSLLFLLMASGRGRAIKLANFMTRELQDSENKLNTILDNVEAYVYIKDRQGRYQYANQLTRQLFNQSLEDIVGKTDDDFFDSATASLFRENDRCVFESGKTITTEEIDAIREETYLAIKQPLYKADGVIYGLCGISTNITNRKQHEEQLRNIALYTRNLIEASLDPLVTISPEGKITDVNIATEHVTGVRRDQLIGSDFTAYFTEPEIAREGYLQVFSQGFVTDYPLAIRHVSGKIFDVLYNASLYRNETGEIQGVFAVARDITERKKLDIAREDALNLLQKIANRVPGVVYQYQLRKDGSACFPFASDGIREIYRVSPEEVCEDACKVFAILHPDDYDGIVDSILASAKNLTQWNYEYRVKFDDGTVRWLFGNALPELETDGSTIWHGFITDITERKQAEESLRMMRFCVEHADASIFWVDRQGRILYVNAAASMERGYSNEEMLDMYIFDLDPDYQSEVWSHHFEDLKQMSSITLETRHRRKDGHIYPIEVNANYVEIGGHEFNFCFLRNITERNLMEDKLRLAASVFTSAREGIMITEADGTIIDVNMTFSHITGYSRDDVIGKKPQLLSSGRHDNNYYAAMWRDLIEKGHWYGEIWNRHKNGEVYAEMQNISAVRDAQGNTQHYVSLFSDITLIKDHEQELEHIAHYDALTNLPNRVLLADRLKQAMAQVKRREQQLVVVFLDLDGFKAINDNHGHKAGDQLLIAIASCMKQTLREGDTLARLGGDEFVAVLTDLDDIEACIPMLSRLLEAASQLVHIEDHVLKVSASLGATVYPQVEDIDADQLLRQADQAMYQAKLAGKNRFHLFDMVNDNSIRIRHESLDRIREAMTEQEFVLYYQPKVNMRTGAITGAEALIRWNHPDKGLLSPALFLPEIEDHPLAIELGEWVINTALTQIGLWRAQGLDITVSVNVGARHLQQSNFVLRLHEILTAHSDIKPSNLELEVLETSALEDITKTSLLINECRKIGVNFALDDFGAGYSSLTYLRRLPVTLLKIDQSFVRDMLEDPEDLAIIEGIVGLARTFRREVIAEGVETVDHGILLLKLGCDMAQGYGIARPMPAHQLLSWSKTWRPDSTWLEQPLMRHDELLLLFASIEQRSWIAAIEAFVKGERDAPPLPLDPYQSRLSMWLNSENLAKPDVQSTFEVIDSLCRQIQALTIELCDLKISGRVPDALSRLGELHALRDELIEQLKVPVSDGVTINRIK